MAPPRVRRAAARSTVESGGRKEGSSYLLVSREKVGKRGRIVVVVLLAVLVVAIGVGVTVTRGHANHPVHGPVATPPTTTVPYGPRPGRNGTTILTEDVDLLSLSIPNDWKAPAADDLTLPDEISKFSSEAASLAALLAAQTSAAGKAAVRLFAYQPVAPRAFVSVVSFSSPTVDPLTPEALAAVVADTKRKVPSVNISGARLPVGEALIVDSSLDNQKPRVAVEVLYLVLSSRSVVIEMATEVDGPQAPPIFGQIAQSLRQA